MELKCIIEEAKCCSAKLGHKWAMAAKFGNETEELTQSFLGLNALIRTLERNVPEIETLKIPIEKKVDFSSLRKQNNVLTLDSVHQEYECIEIEKRPCLSDDEILEIVEQIKLMCSTCNCNCQ